MTDPFQKGKTWGLMIAILGIAIAWARWVYTERRAAFRVRAEHHLGEMAAMASLSHSNGFRADVWEGKIPFDKAFVFLNPVSDTRHLRAEEALYAQRADHHAALSGKYREAANRPWTSVEPDPTSP